MSLNPLQQKQIMDLLILSLEGEAGSEDMRKLKEILNASSEARDYYLKAIIAAECIRKIAWETQTLGGNSADSESLNAVLWKALAEAEKEAPAVEITVPEEPIVPIQKVQYQRVIRKISKGSLFTLFAAAAAIVLIILGNWFLPTKTSRPVASITSGIDARWSGSNETYKTGTRLWNDGNWYQLNRGLAEVTFDNGAKVLLESPSQFKVLSENEMVFQGRLTAEVSESAYGFTVVTSNSKVVDLGTEFGVITSAEEGTEVHVRKGQVQMTGTSSGNTNPLMQLIKAGQGGQISSSGVLSTVEYDKDKFYWDMPSPYVYAVKKTNPLYYWRFDWGQDRIMRNEMTPQVNLGNYITVKFNFNSGPAIGGDQPNRALYFSGSKENYVVLYDRPEDYASANGLSIVLWVRPEVSKIQDIIVHRKKDSSEKHTDEITLTEDNRVRFYVFCPPDLPEPWTSEIKTKGYNLLLSNPIPLNQWTHVAVTYTNRDRMNLYINGQLEASRKLSGMAQMYPDIDCWYIGSEWQDFAKEIVDKPRDFRGSVDEISRYNRELSAEEVRMLYESAGKHR